MAGGGGRSRRRTPRELPVGLVRLDPRGREAHKDRKPRGRVDAPPGRDSRAPASIEISVGRQREAVMSGLKLSLVIVATVIVGSAFGAGAAERQQARHVRPHAGFASLDYGRTQRTMF